MEKSLYNAFLKAINSSVGNSNTYEDYVGFKKKWHEAIMTQSEVWLAGRTNLLTAEEVAISEKALQKLITHFQAKMEIAKKKLLSILDKKVPLSKIANIQGYTEFDLLEWDITDKKTLIKYKPKGASISFWHADPKNIKY